MTYNRWTNSSTHPALAGLRDPYLDKYQQIHVPGDQQGTFCTEKRHPTETPRAAINGHPRRRGCPEKNSNHQDHDASSAHLPHRPTSCHHEGDGVEKQQQRDHFSGHRHQQEHGRLCGQVRAERRWGGQGRWSGPPPSYFPQRHPRPCTNLQGLPILLRGGHHATGECAADERREHPHGPPGLAQVGLHVRHSDYQSLGDGCKQGQARGLGKRAPELG